MTKLRICDQIENLWSNWDQCGNLVTKLRIYVKLGNWMDRKMRTHWPDWEFMYLSNYFVTKLRITWPYCWFGSQIVIFDLIVYDQIENLWEFGGKIENLWVNWDTKFSIYSQNWENGSKLKT